MSGSSQLGPVYTCTLLVFVSSLINAQERGNAKQSSLYSIVEQFLQQPCRHEANHGDGLPLLEAPKPRCTLTRAKRQSCCTRIGEQPSALHSTLLQSPSWPPHHGSLSALQAIRPTREERPRAGTPTTWKSTVSEHSVLSICTHLPELKGRDAAVIVEQDSYGI